MQATLKNNFIVLYCFNKRCILNLYTLNSYICINDNTENTPEFCVNAVRSQTACSANVSSKLLIGSAHSQVTIWIRCVWLFSNFMQSCSNEHKNQYDLFCLISRGTRTKREYNWFPGNIKKICQDFPTLMFLQQINQDTLIVSTSLHDNILLCHNINKNKLPL